MSDMRRINMFNLQTFKVSFKVAWISFSNVCSFSQLNVVYYNYIIESMKHGKLQRNYSLQRLPFVNV